MSSTINKGTKFWVNIDSTKPLDLLELSTYKKAVANFVHIACGDSTIPVNFASKGGSYAKGKEVTISTDITNDNFDCIVGLALHEGSHILHSDMENYKFYLVDKSREIFDNHPNASVIFSDKSALFKKLHTVVNIVEDLRVDSYMKRNAPGYVVYYDALAEMFYTNTHITTALVNKERRSLSIDDYIFHIICLSHPNSDVTVYNNLTEIKEIIDAPYIHRLDSIYDAIDISVDIFNLILDEVTTINTTDKAKRKVTNDAISELTNLVDGKVDKKALSTKDELVIAELDKAGTSVETVFNGTQRTIVVNTFDVTNPLIKNHINPLNAKKVYNTSLGRELKRKLQPRNEYMTEVSTRLPHGKIDRRLLAEIGVGNTNIFSQVKHPIINPILVYMSIDASGSMRGEKWERTVETSLAIAYATAGIDGIDCVLTIRGSAPLGGSTNHSPLLLTLYDSRSHTKVQTLQDIFAVVRPEASTPEGLCFEAIRNTLIKQSHISSVIFVNISDGAPAFHNYGGKDALDHTRDQINLFKRNNIEVLSYFVVESKISKMDRMAEEARFRYMYGNTAEVIDVSNISALAVTLNNKLMLSTECQ